MSVQPFAAGLTGSIGRANYPTHTYTYLFCDLLTDTVLAELPLSGVTYSTVLNGIGTLTATVPYNDDTLPADPETATTPGRTALYVDRDGVIVWAGIVWTRKPVAGGKSIQASEFLSYFQHRYVTKTLSTDPSQVSDTRMVPDGQVLYADQKFIAWSLLTWALVQPNGSIGIDTNPITADATGIARSVTYSAAERPEIYKSISDVASSDDGYDWGLEVGWTPAANNMAPSRFKRARVWYPRRGRPADESGLVFAKGGPGSTIIDYDWPEDGTQLANQVSGLGDGTDDARVVAVAQNTDMLKSGWPLLESVTTYTGVSDTAQLTGLTNAEINARGRALTQPTFTVSADDDPAFGSYQVGDEATFVIDPEPLMPAGLDVPLRIVQIENTAASGPERIKLTCVAV